MGPSGRFLVVKSDFVANLWVFPSNLDKLENLSQGERLSFGEVKDRRPRWAPGDDAVYFESNRRGGLDVWRLSLGIDNPVRLTSGLRREFRPRVSPQHSWIAFDVSDERGEFTYLMRPDGGNIRDLGFRNNFELSCCAAWSPDGSQIAIFLEGRIGIVDIDPETGTAQKIQLLDLPGEAEEYASWSPDGRFITYEAVENGNWSLWITRPNGTDARRLTFESTNERYSAWSKDSRFVYFVRHDYGDYWRIPMDADTGTPTGAPQLWFTPPNRHRVANDSVDFTKDKVVMAIAKDASDIWLVEFRE